MPILPAFAFTIEKSQGQNIFRTVVDLVHPPTGSGIKLNGLYVACSRSSGREGIRILRPIPENVVKTLKTHSPESLRRDAETLTGQAQRTREMFKRGTLFDR